MSKGSPQISVRQVSPVQSAIVVNARVQRSREALLDAARQLLLEGGPAAITVDAVAARSGVAKSTLYRQWATRDEMVVDVFDHIAPPVIHVDPTLGGRDALRAFGRELAANMGAPEWKSMTPALLLLKLHQADFAVVEERMQVQQRAALDEVLQRGVDDGLLRPDALTDTAFVMLIGPFLLASLSGVVPLDDDFADAVTGQFIEGHRRAPALA